MKLQLLGIQKYLGIILTGWLLSSDQQDSLASESSVLEEEISSIASSYSSSESSSGGGRGRAYRRGYRDAQRYGPDDYRQIPRRRRW